MEVPEESFHLSSWDSRTCYPRRAFIQGLTDDYQGTNLRRSIQDSMDFSLALAGKGISWRRHLLMAWNGNEKEIRLHVEKEIES